MRESGADRVSDSAKIELKNLLEEKCKIIAERAIKYCSHAGRKTIKPEDIKLAIESFR